MAFCGLYRTVQDSVLLSTPFSSTRRVTVTVKPELPADCASQVGDWEYTVVGDVTPEINLRWKNNTPYGALVQSWVEGGRVYVRIWSTPYWTVESTTSGRSGVTSPTTVYSQAPTCEAQSAGNSGFTVTVTRRVLLNGVENSTESWTVRYKPQNAIVCGVPPG